MTMTSRCDLLVVLHLGAGPHVNAAAPGAVGFDDAGPAVDDAGGGKIRPGDVLHQPVDADVRIVDQREAGVDDLPQVVRRNVGGHAHGDARGAVDQQVRHPGGHHVRHAQGVIVVRHEVDSFLVEICQQLRGHARHAHFGVTHGRRRIAVHASRSCPARPPAGSAGRTAGPCAPWCRRWPRRHGGGTCRSPRRPPGPISCTGG